MLSALKLLFLRSSMNILTKKTFRFIKIIMINYKKFFPIIKKSIQKNSFIEISNKMKDASTKKSSDIKWRFLPPSYRWAICG